jgi:hypothetical protein
MKNKITDLISSPYFGKKDGIYIKNEVYDAYRKNQEKITEDNAQKRTEGNIRIKMICDWCSSEQLCMAIKNKIDDEDNYCWKNIQITWENDDIEFDLGWSVEFLEHVESKHVPAIMHAFQRCKYLMVTAAPPGYTGHHHVNCRNLDYWEGAFNASGFYYDADMTAKIKDASSMKKPFLQMNGMFYRRFHYDN